MGLINKSSKTNFKPKPQTRKLGSGTGRSLFPWKKRYAWLVLAVEQMYVLKAGSSEALLEERNWAKTYGLTTDWLWQKLYETFPGLTTQLTNEHREMGIKTFWSKNLHNRVYKMYYNGTSARGTFHDPTTRASVSREHWRANVEFKELEETIIKVVSGQLKVSQKTWQGWSR